MLVRLLVCEACRRLTTRITTPDGFQRLEDVFAAVATLKPQAEPDIWPKEVMEICETEGNAQNGGGTLVTTERPGAGWFLKFEHDKIPAIGRAPGDIGSPIVGGAMPFGGGHRGFGAGVLAPAHGF